MKEAEEEKNKERERLWNMPIHARARTNSSLGMDSPNDRMRTNSTPTRSESAQGYLSPVHTTPTHGLHRKQSITSLSGSSRANSPVQSPAQPVEIVEKDHLRERNWNSPHPKWRPTPPRRSVSPLPESPAAVTAERLNGINGINGINGAGSRT